MAEDSSFFDPQLTHFEQPDVNWEYLFQPSEWYITPEVITENYVSLAVALGAVTVAALVFIFARRQGIKSDWYRKLKLNNFIFSDSTLLQLWLLMYIPLGISSWLVWIHGGKEWSRSLTVYSLHLLVNVLFAVSFWWVKDMSLALLNLITLIGVSMFTSTQFNSILKFASFINTPYLFFLLIYLIQFAYNWYLNDGKEMLDIAQNMRRGAVSTKDKKKRTSALPADVKKKLQEKLQKERENNKEKQQ
jgi:benzodiazapine receptor